MQMRYQTTPEPLRDHPLLTREMIENQVKLADLIIVSSLTSLGDAPGIITRGNIVDHNSGKKQPTFGGEGARKILDNI